MRASRSISGFPLSDTGGPQFEGVAAGRHWHVATVLIITLPTIAAAFWQGSMGSFMHFSAFCGGGASSLGPQGQPVGSYVPPRINGASTSTGNASTQSVASSRVSGAPQTPATYQRKRHDGPSEKNSAQPA